MKNKEKKYTSLLDEQKFKNNPFSTPKDYFERLENKVLDKTCNKTKTRIINTFYFKVAAASIVLLFAAASIFYWQKKSEYTETDSASLVIEHILEDSELYFDSDEEYLKILVALESENPDSKNASASNESVISSDISDESIIEYLIQESEMLNFEL